MKKAQQAPFDKRSETIVETTASKTWELDGEQFSFQNPARPAYMESVCLDVAKSLGIQSPITAEIYKMLIY